MLFMRVVIAALFVQIYGISGGYSGFHDPDKPVIELDNATNLEFLQHRAGSILGCSAGGFDINKIMDFLISKEVGASVVMLLHHNTKQIRLVCTIVIMRLHVSHRIYSFTVVYSDGTCCIRGID
jgi:hypothetical protein